MGGEAGIDHARRVQGEGGADDAGRRGHGPPARNRAEHDPADGERAGGQVGRNRPHALARQPRAAPLGEGAPRPLGMAEMEGRGEEARRDAAEREAQPDDADPAVRRDQPGKRIGRQQRQQPVPRPRRGGEEDDRISRAHRRTPPAWVRPPSRPPPFQGGGDRCGASLPLKGGGQVGIGAHRDSSASTQRSSRPAGALSSSSRGAGGGAVVASRRGRGGK